jgi:glycosyltransferase involved in cell wall biosynthesis
MKLAIIHDFLTKLGGAEKVLQAIHELYPEAPIFTLLYDAEGTKNQFEDGYSIIPSSLQKKPALLRKPRYLLSQLPKAIEEFDLSEYDVVISSSNSYAHGVLTKPKTTHISYCHSPMRYVWDWYHEYLQENNIGFDVKGLYIRNLLHKIRIWDYVASKRVDFWLANSKNVQKRIEKYYRAESEVLYPPVNVEGIEASNDLPDDYYLVVSRLEPYKRIETVIQAFNQSGKSLVVIGEGSQEYALKQLANDNIEFLGWQSDESVYEYMRNSKALIFPGEDDFGITPVESMAAGRPVIAYESGGTTETVIDDKTGLFFDGTVRDLNDKVDKLEKNYFEYSSTNCRKQAEQFSKEVFKNKLTDFVSAHYAKKND